MSTNPITPTSESIQPKTDSKSKTSMSMEYEKKRLKQYLTTTTLPPPINVWFNGNNGKMETHEISSSTTETQEKMDDYVGKEQFFATGPYLGSGPDVYGAVVQEPRDSQLGMVGSGSSDVNEFGLLKRILYKEPNGNDRWVIFISIIFFLS